MFFCICDVPPMTLCARLYNDTGRNQDHGVPTTATAGMPYGLLDPGHQQLVKRPLRAITGRRSSLSDSGSRT